MNEKPIGPGMGDESGEPGDVTEWLWARNAGAVEAEEHLIPLVYEELRRMAEVHLGRERRDHTLQPTALVHEAYLRLFERRVGCWKDRRHFFAVASHAMRCALVDHARRRKAGKRGGAGVRIPLEEAIFLAAERPRDLLLLDDSLRALAQLDPRKAAVVELRFFGGLSIDETAEVIGHSRGTVIRDWRMAQTWLYLEMQDGCAVES